MATRVTNAERIVAALRDKGPLTDAQLRRETGVEPHQQVNQICHRLAKEGRLRRDPGPNGHLVNILVDAPQPTRRPQPASPDPAVESEPAATPSTRDRVQRAFELLAAGLKDFVDSRMTSSSPHGKRWLDDYLKSARPPLKHGSMDDPALLLRVMFDCWNLAFRSFFPSRSERTLVRELQDTRNLWAHILAPMSSDDAYRALDSVQRLLVAVGAPQAQEVRRLKDQLLRERLADSVPDGD